MKLYVDVRIWCFRGKEIHRLYHICEGYHGKM